ILITGRDDLYGVLGCGNPAEFYVSSQGCSLTGNLPRRSNQGDHSGLFKWTAVRSPDVNVQVDGRIAAPQRGRADAPAVRAAGIRRRPLRENGMREKERSKKRSEEHTSELQSPYDLVCRLLLEKKKTRM